MPVPTPRLLLVALLGVVPAVLAPSHDVALLAALLWLFAVGAATWIDARLAASEVVFPWERTHDQALSLGAWNRVTLTARNRSGRSVRFRARDAVPRLFARRDEATTGVLEPGEQREVTYSVYPIHRGDFQLGPLSVRTLGPLGLAWHEFQTLGNDPVRVYPNLLAIRQYDALLRSGRLFEAGFHRARVRGEGSEFERLRPYTPDDEYRRVDWKATARRATPIVKDFESERSQSIVFGLDTGRLMSTRVPIPAHSEVAGAPVGTPPLTRLDYSLNASLLLAYVAESYGDRVGAIAFADQVNRFLPPRSGRGQFVALTETLYNVEPESVETDFTEAAATLQTRLSRRSLLVFFTDILDPDTARPLVAQLALLSRRHLCLLVTLQDPEVHRMAGMDVRTSRDVYERAVAQRALQERAGVLAALASRGVLTLDVSADRISASVINEYLEIKRRGRL